MSIEKAVVDIGSSYSVWPNPMLPLVGEKSHGLYLYKGECTKNKGTPRSNQIL